MNIKKSVEIVFDGQAEYHLAYIFDDNFKELWDKKVRVTIEEIEG